MNNKGKIWMDSGSTLRSNTFYEIQNMSKECSGLDLIGTDD